MPPKVVNMAAAVDTRGVLQKFAAAIFTSIFLCLRLHCTYHSNRNLLMPVILGRVIARNLKNKDLHFVVIFCTYLLHLSDIFLYLIR